MTSAPVKDVGSLMNYVGSRAAISSGIGAESTGAFGDVMNKASESRQEPVSGQTAVTDTAKETRVDKTHTRPQSQKVDTDNKTVETKADKEEVTQAVEEAGKELVKETAKKLGVSEEEVLKAMEMLGFGMESLLNAENLTQLVLTITGSDSLTLLTDEGLYSNLQDLLATMQDMQTQIQETFSMNPQEMEQLLKEMSADRNMSENLTVGQEETNADILNGDVAEENAKVTVTVEEGTQSVKLTTDENGNVKQVETVTAKDNGSQNAENQGTDHQEKQQMGSETGSMQQGTLLNDVMSNKVLNAEMTFEQAAAYMAPDTEQIMNQIMDYMKIQLKPGMSQLEMQLHPESLGTLHIQLTSKGGEVTAQFQVQNEAVKAAIESQIMELKEVLRDQGVKVEAVEVTVESHAFEQNLWQGQGREEDASYQGNRRSPRRINLNMLEEGFEEEASEEEVLAAKMMEANGNTVDYTA